jgi:fatty acid desaturase
VYFNLIVRSWIYIIEHRKYSEILLSLGYICILPASFVLVFGFFWGLIGWIFISLLVGAHLAFVFMVNHIGMEIIDGKKVREYTWIDLQTRTSRNIFGGECIHQIFGGLNKQIEHHLFPRISRYRIRAVSLEVKEFAKEKWLPYHEVTFVEAIREIYMTLRTGKTL